MVQIRAYQEQDLPAMTAIWNRVVEDGQAFPQMEPLTEQEALEFFSAQTFTAVADNGDEVVGLYILHPNNVGRCGHLANASYAVKEGYRGQHIGEMLVRHCIQQTALCGFRILQFNAVVATNKAAHHLYEKIGFQRLGIVPKGFLMKNGQYEDIVLYYMECEKGL